MAAVVYNHYPFQLLILIWVLTLVFCSHEVSSSNHQSAIGDPGMKREGMRVAFEAWNFCNEVGEEAPTMGSPRAADCFDVIHRPNGEHKLYHRVSSSHNKLGIGKSFPGLNLNPLAARNPDLYAARKEEFLGKLCQVNGEHGVGGRGKRIDSSYSFYKRPWQFWMVMLKNGNFDTRSALCPENGKRVGPFPPPAKGQPGRKFPCFGHGCMNQPLFYHQHTKEVVIHGGSRCKTRVLQRGSFSGTYDLEFLGKSGSEIGRLASRRNISYYRVVWEKETEKGVNSSIGGGGWKFHHKLQTSRKYPWLMLYLRADATSGFSGGYHYNTRGMLKILPKSPHFRVRLHMEVKQGGGPKSQFYLLDMGSCWKNNGKPCDGDVTTDVTRYSEMIINPASKAVCNATNLRACPPYHVYPNGTSVHRTDKARFPYAAYHYYCGPGNGKHLEKPGDTCDPYSNPQAQEIMQILPHPVWGVYGYPTEKGQGWIGDPRKWDLDVGGISSRLYFYQDPGTKPAERIWTSLDTGTEIYVSDSDQEVAEWTVSQFDVILTH